ncbi:MAG: flagellar assembly peptidoglycan hydrolase FlgJ [Steroidobacteraceae bacterium]
MTLPIVDSSTASALADTGNLSALKEAVTKHSPQALRQAAQQFESLFTGMVLKSMRQANFGDSLFGSDQEDMYQDMYDDQIASEISKGRGLGLADRLVQQLRGGGIGGADRESSIAAGAASHPASSTSSISAGSAAGATRTAPAASGTSGTPASAPAASASTSTNPSACPSTTQQLQFAQSLWPEAQQAARQLGVSPVSLVAQAALETDWGRSLPRTSGGSSSNNLFGIKAGGGWNGASVQSNTREYDSGAATAVKAQFRSYATPSQCFQDYVSLLQSNPRYAGALGTGANTEAFAAALQRGGYATDPAYASKLGAVATTLTRALTQALQGALGSGYSAGSLKSPASLPTTSGSNTL